MSLELCSEGHNEIVYQSPVRGLVVTCPVCALKEEVKTLERENSELINNVEKLKERLAISSEGDVDVYRA